LVVFMPFDTFSAYQGRQELAALNEQLAAATEVRNKAQQAFDWVALPASLLENAAAEHLAEKSAYDAMVVDWYTEGCVGERPPVPASLVQVERRIGELRSDLGASEHALETAGEAVQTASVNLARVSDRHPLQKFRSLVDVPTEWVGEILQMTSGVELLVE
jgi:hypothetical protein